MTELEKKKMFNKMVGDYIKQEVGYVDEQEVTDEVKNKFVWKAPEKGKKVAQDYICNKCGRIKTVRFKTNPTPASLASKCPRCKEGTMYSRIVYDDKAGWVKANPNIILGVDLADKVHWDEFVEKSE